jgi:hypothetical protein
LRKTAKRKGTILESAPSEGSSECGQKDSSLIEGKRVRIKREIHQDGRIAPPGSPYYPMFPVGSEGTVVETGYRAGAVRVTFQIDDKTYGYIMYPLELEIVN